MDVNGVLYVYVTLNSLLTEFNLQSRKIYIMREFLAKFISVLTLCVPVLRNIFFR
jgi:hypothetical protein